MQRILMIFLFAITTAAGPAISGKVTGTEGQHAINAEQSLVALNARAHQSGLSDVNGVNNMSTTNVPNLASGAQEHTVARQVEAGAAPTPALPPVMQQLVHAIEARDSSTFVALYAQNATHEDVAAAILARGREEIRGYVEDTWSQFPDFQFVPVSGRQAADIAWLEYQFSATDPASGRSFTSRGVVIFELEDELVRRSADYSDFSNVLVQLGQLVPGTGTPPSAPDSQ